MFQLIVAVISIALIAALAIASIFYGGDAFTKSSEKAVVTTLINQAQQIAGAASLYHTDNGTSVGGVTSVEIDDEHALIADGYLSSVPNGARVTVGNWFINENATYIDLDQNSNVPNLCEEVERQGVGECMNGQTIYSFSL